jgi:hypothetical protein
MMKRRYELPEKENVITLFMFLTESICTCRTMSGPYQGDLSEAQSEQR